jgi:hypothetical protein
MTIPAMKRLHRSVNVTGRLTATCATVDGLTQKALLLKRRNFHATGMKAVTARLAINGCLATGLSFGLIRAATPITLAKTFTSGGATACLFPAAEFVFGRGLRPQRPMDPNSPFIFKVEHVWGHVAAYGVAGLVLEDLPLRLAEMAQTRGADRIAMTCIGSAVITKCILQVPRALVTIWGISVALTFAAFYMVVMEVPGVAARGLRWGIDHVAADEPGQPRQGIRNWLDRVINFTNRQHLWRFVEQATFQEGFRLPRDPGGPGINDRVRELAEAMLLRFMEVRDTDADGGAAILQVAEGIAQDLRRYCSLERHTTELRGGLRLLHDFMELTYGELQWPLPEELQE